MPRRQGRPARTSQGPPRSAPSLRHHHPSAPQLDHLQQAGLIERVRPRSLVLWKLTDAGRTRLDRIRRAAELVLPESPQHRRWARARFIAAERIAELRAELRRTLDQAAAMLEAQTTGSDDWFALIPQLNEACRRLAAATHIVHEWDEPDDSRADIDTHPQLDRRNIHAWSG